MAPLDDLIVRLQTRAAVPNRCVDVRPSAFSADVAALDLGGLFGRLGQASAGPETSGRRQPVRARQSTSWSPGRTRSKPRCRLRSNRPCRLRPPRRRSSRQRPTSGLRSRGISNGSIATSPIGVSVVAWDPDELSERASEQAWSRSFREISPSVEQWLGEWVASNTQEETMQDLMRQSMIESVRQSRAYFAAMTPEERAAYGLPEVGWEREIGGHLGLDEDEIQRTS